MNSQRNYRLVYAGPLTIAVTDLENNLVGAVNFAISGKGGLDSGNPQTNTWYYIYVNPRDPNIKCMASHVDPRKRKVPRWTNYIAAVRMDEDGCIRPFDHDPTELRMTWKEPTCANTGGTPVVNEVSSF
jgi:hypothetical protein